MKPARCIYKSAHRCYGPLNEFSLCAAAVHPSSGMYDATDGPRIDTDWDEMLALFDRDLDEPMT